MADDAIIETHIESEILDKATEVFALAGMSVNDAVRLLLTRTANEGEIPAHLVVEDPAYDAWLRAKVQEALDDPRPDIPDEEVRAEFARRYETVAAKAGAASK